MGRKDRRPESRPERNTGEDVSEKATDTSIFDDQGGDGQTEAGERTSETGQYTDAGSPGQIKR